MCLSFSKKFDCFVVNMQIHRSRVLGFHQIGGTCTNVKRLCTILSTMTWLKSTVASLLEKVKSNLGNHCIYLTINKRFLQGDKKYLGFTGSRREVDDRKLHTQN